MRDHDDAGDDLDELGGTPAAAGSTASPTFVAVPMSTTLSSVPTPGRSPSGHQSARIGRPSAMLTVPSGTPNWFPSPWWNASHGPEAEPGPGHERDPDPEHDEPGQQARQATAGSRPAASVRASADGRGARPVAARGARPAGRRGGTLRVMTIELQFLGAATTVTGSQFLLTTDRARILIDCGMFQGSPNESVRNRIPLAYDPTALDAILLTHAHLDHCGLIPHVVKEGFGGPIWATRARSSWPRSCSSTPASSRRSSPSATRAGRSATRTRPRVEDRQDEAALEAAVELAERGRADDHPGRPAGPYVVPPPGRAATGEHVATAIEPRGGRDRSPDSPTRSASCRPSRRTSTSTSTSRSTPSAMRRPPSPRSAASTTATELEVAPGIHATFVDAGHILGSAIIRLRVTRRRRHRHADRLLGRPRPARHADPPRPDGRDRRRVRPGRIDLRRTRARAGRGGDAHPGRDRAPRRRQRRRAARPVVRDRPDPGGRLGARPAARGRQDPAPAAVPRLADGLEGVRRLPPPPRLLRRGDPRPPRHRGLAARLPAPGDRRTTTRPRRRSPGRRGRT